MRIKRTPNEPYKHPDLTKVTARDVRNFVLDRQDEDNEDQRQLAIVTEFMRDWDGKNITGVRFANKVRECAELAPLAPYVENAHGMVHLKTTDADGYERSFLLAYTSRDNCFDLEAYLHHSGRGFNTCYGIGSQERNEKRARILAGNECAELAKLTRAAARAVAALKAWEKANYYNFPDCNPFLANKLNTKD